MIDFSDQSRFFPECSLGLAVPVYAAFCTSLQRKIVDNYGVAQELPIALRSAGTAFDEVRLEKTEIPKTKNRRSAVQLFVQSSAT